MDKQLIVPSERTVKEPQNAYTDFSLPFFTQEMLFIEKDNLLRTLARTAIEADTIVQIANASMLKVIIPENMRAAIANGTAHFDKSNKIKGDFSPTIRMNDGSGIEANVTLRGGLDTSAISASLANLSYMLMMEQALDSLQEIETTVNKIAVGQKTDRYAKVVGAFMSYYNRISEFKTEEEKRMAATIALNDMSEGLAAVHQQFDPEYQFLLTAPQNGFMLILRSFGQFLFKKPNTTIYKQKYVQFINDISNYYKFILLKDVIQLSIGDSMSTIEKGNHVPFEKMCNRFYVEEFTRRMKATLQCNANELELLADHCHEDRKALAQPTPALLLPLSKDDIKLIETEYEKRD